MLISEITLSTGMGTEEIQEHLDEIINLDALEQL